VEAGALHSAAVEAENAGSAPWRTLGPDEGVFIAYHWLDERGKVTIDYRPVHTYTMTNEISYIEPKARVY